MKHILVTGATGFLGKETVRQLLDNTGHHLYLLIRAKQGKAAEERLKWINASHRSRVTCIEGNIESADVFQHAKDRKFCEENINEILHLAASVEFSESKRKEIVRANLEGTSNLLGVAKGFKRLSCFNHISTAYVAGNRFSPEVIHETALDKPAAGYKNPYEESKHQAEQLVINSGLPWTIMRPSIIVGSADGSYFGNNTIYAMCNVIFNARLLSMEAQGYDAFAKTDMSKRITLDAPLVGRADSRCNVIHVDVAARMICTIMDRNDKFSRFFHICSPQTATLGALMTPMLELLNVDGVSYAERKNVDAQKLSMPAGFIFNHLRAISDYIVEDDPAFSLKNTTQVLDNGFVNAMPAFNEDSFRHLLGAFLARAYPTHFSNNAPIAGDRRQPPAIHRAS
jgi:nucleoside-diphosphate-sugar epimerase